ncbi:MAG TPA: aminotransferase class IV [Pyrinomonadaceae bacterium]|nr:aminotransferase class IV [Pyrinomonadaceae bacterium]
MHKFVSFDRRIIPAHNSLLSAVSAAALYGKGIFTTVAFYNSKPFLWEKHRRRLSAAAEKLQIDLTDLTEEKLKAALFEIADANRLRRGRARLTIFDESPSRVWQTEPKNKTSFLIQTADFRPSADNLRLTVSPFSINSKSPLAGVKTCNYLENILALEDANAKGFDEAVRLNERKETVSATTANIFWVKNGEIFTPSLETECLAGTTRAFIAENFAVRETKADTRELIDADEVFLTSAGIGISRVETLNEKCFFDLPETTTNLQKFFQSFTETL